MKRLGIVMAAILCIAAIYDLSIHNVQLAYTTWAESTAPSTPASGKVAVYGKSTGELCSISDAGVEVCMSAGGGGGGGDNISVIATPATDADFIASTWVTPVLNTAAAPDTIRMDIIAGSIGSTEVAGLDAADITTGTWADARVDGSLEAGEVVGTETDEALCSWETTGLLVECDLTVNAGTALTADLEEEAHCSEHDSTDVDCSGETITIADGVTVTGWDLGASIATTPAGNDNDTSLATSAFVQAEIDDGDFLTDNCILENDSTPIPDSCVGDGFDAGGGGGGITYADMVAANLAGF
jgi:hypothetical protein